MDGTIGEIVLFGGTFAPRNWAFCEGQLLQISQNQALFSVLGTAFGGNGETSFALPDLRGRVPVGVGAGTGLSTYANPGVRAGANSIALTAGQIPPHGHADGGSSPTVKLRAHAANPADAEIPDPGNIIGQNAAVAAFSTSDDPTTLASLGGPAVTVGNGGGGQAHENRQPTLGVHYVICLVGIFPSRN